MKRLRAMRLQKVGIELAAMALAAAACASATGAVPRQLIGCAQAVYGPPDGWRSAPSTVGAGVAAWPYFRSPPSRSSYGPHGGLAVFVKALLFVEPGHAVTVRIPTRERNRLSLLYGKTFEPRTQWHGADWFRLSEGAAAITFEACPRGRYSGWTQFAGGFLVLGPQCAAVEVRARGSPRWLRRRLPFGKGTCA